MGVFVLHAGQPELSRFLGRLQVPAGTAPPRPDDGRSAWTVVSFRGDAKPIRLPGGVGSPMQPASAVRRASDARRAAEDLRRHGIRTLPPGKDVRGSIYRTFVVPVFGLEALGSFAAGAVGGPMLAAGTLRRPPSSEPREAASAEAPRPTAQRRAEHAAVRAVYALGLDYGVVRVRTGEDGAAYVVSVDASPLVASGEFAPLFASAVNRLQEAEDAAARAGEGGGTLLLGMDPEFVLKKPGPEGKIVSASRYFERRGRVGCDSVRIGDKIVYPLAELRPSPAAEPRELLRNLYAAMRLAASRIDDASLEWLAGGMPAPGLPLGGHIHVSGVALNADLLRAMDNYMALPLALLEDEPTKRRRPRYGALGDFRRQFHGGFEYRTLPSWIVSPAVALGVISLAKVVCEHVRELRERPLARPELQAAYYAGDKETLLPAALARWSELERTAGYARYAKALDGLKRRVARAEPWNERQDVRPAWKIPPYRV
ncbi:hypothetical protein [Paenibacillus sp.]|uniref:putative amidoligase domain-containing protein n=1 Tax=Paenibacillus sp. TaxID=58172 RepID=UPI0028111932|nr:hypothetical protein [Paenibacillus sp.]